MAQMKKRYLEQFIWILALFILYGIDVEKDQISLCFFKFMGFGSCPGCGIGHAIHYALHLDFQKSFQEHWLGIPAAILLIIQIVKPFISYNKSPIWTSSY